MPTKNLLPGLAAGLILALVLLPSIIAALYDWHPSLGIALDPSGYFYNPLSLIRWVSWWGDRPGFQETLLTAGGISLVPFFLPLLFVAARQSNLDPGERFKDAGLGTIRDLKRTGFIEAKPGRTVLGDAAGGKVLCAGSDKHSLILGPSGSDKDVAHVIPSLLMDEGSALIFDPKRELGEITARRRREFGEVHILDLGDPRPDSASFNPFDVVRKGFEIEDCALIAHLLAFQHGDDDKGGKASTWNEASAKMLTAGAAHVHFSSDRTMAHLRRWVQAVLEQNYPEPNNDYTTDAIMAHAALNNDTRTSVNFNLDTSTAFLAQGESVKRVLAESSFDPADLMCGDRPMTVFVTVSPSHRKSLRALQRLVITMLVHPLKARKLHAADGRPKLRPLTLHLPEFTTMGKLDLIEPDMKDLRGFGFRYVLSTQGVEEIKGTYGENTSVMLNSQVIVAIPGFGEKTNRFLTEACGKTWVVKKSTSHKRGSLWALSTSKGEEQINVYSMTQAQERALTHSLVLARGSKPVWVKRARYFEHPAFRRLYDNQEGSELLRG